MTHGPHTRSAALVAPPPAQHQTASVHVHRQGRDRPALDHAPNPRSHLRTMRYGETKQLLTA